MLSAGAGGLGTLGAFLGLNQSQYWTFGLPRLLTWHEKTTCFVKGFFATGQNGEGKEPMTQVFFRHSIPSRGTICALCGGGAIVAFLVWQIAATLNGDVKEVAAGTIANDANANQHLAVSPASRTPTSWPRPRPTASPAALGQGPGDGPDDEDLALDEAEARAAPSPPPRRPFDPVALQTVVTDLDQRIEQGEADLTRTARTEKAVADALAEADLEGTELHEVHCISQFCRIVFSFNTMSDVEEFMRSRAIEGSWAQGERFAVAAGVGGRPAFKAYVAGDHGKLPTGRPVLELVAETEH